MVGIALDRFWEPKMRRRDSRRRKKLNNSGYSGVDGAQRLWSRPKRAQPLPLCNHCHSANLSSGSRPCIWTRVGMWPCYVDTHRDPPRETLPSANYPCQ